MARSTMNIIAALRSTATTLAVSKGYQWGHMGACNCGFLAQEVTHLHKKEIHASAMAGHGDWSEQLRDYCPTSGLPMDSIITEITEFGFSIDDLAHLEWLSDARIRARMANKNPLYNVKRDVIEYLETWALMLEEDYLNRISLSQIELKTEILV